MNNDIINGCFETVGGVLIWFNIFKLFKDKQTKGLYLPVCVFFCVWSLWNIIYYPSLNQTLSFIGAIFLGIANIIWIILAYYYKLKNRVDNQDFFR